MVGSLSAEGEEVGLAESLGEQDTDWLCAGLETISRSQHREFCCVVTALPLCSQPWVSPGNTHVPSTAQSQKGVYPGESKALLAGEVGYRTPFPGTLPV